MEKTNCYNCKFKGTVPGSAHSRCNAIRESLSNESESSRLEMLLAGNLVSMTISEGDAKGEPIVKLNEHGVKNGWACWPLDFDPIWVDDCKFYKEKENLAV
jgi:hypothetical protein